jgi:uncharacterized protein (DUF1330 family)
LNPVNGTPIVADGDWPTQHNLVVIEFPSADQLKAWYIAWLMHSCWDIAHHLLG